MTFPEPGSGPTFEFDDLWEDTPPFSEELGVELHRLGDRAAGLHSFLSWTRSSDLVVCW